MLTKQLPLYRKNSWQSRHAAPSRFFGRIDQYRSANIWVRMTTCNGCTLKAVPQYDHLSFFGQQAVKLSLPPSYTAIEFHASRAAINSCVPKLSRNWA